MKKCFTTLVCFFFVCNSYAQAIDCRYIKSGTIRFPPHSCKFASITLSTLHALALQMKSANQCHVVLIGKGSGNSNEMQQSWDRVNCCINFLVEKEHINREQFIFMYGASGDPNSIEFRTAYTGEEGPSNTPPPFPNLRRRM